MYFVFPFLSYPFAPFLFSFLPLSLLSSILSHPFIHPLFILFILVPIYMLSISFIHLDRLPQTPPFLPPSLLPSLPPYILFLRFLFTCYPLVTVKVKITLRILNVNYTRELENKNTVEYKEFEDNFKKQVISFCIDDDIYHPSLLKVYLFLALSPKLF